MAFSIPFCSTSFSIASIHLANLTSCTSFPSLLFSSFAATLMMSSQEVVRGLTICSANGSASLEKVKSSVARVTVSVGSQHVSPWLTFGRQPTASPDLMISGSQSLVAQQPVVVLPLSCLQAFEER
jgi:hypothetical protein